MHQADFRSSQRHGHGLRDFRRRNSAKCGLVLLHLKVEFLLVRHDVPVDVHDAWGFIEDCADLPCHFDLSLIIRPVHFGHQCGYDGRALVEPPQL